MQSKTVLMFGHYNPQPKYSGMRRFHDWAQYLTKKGYAVYIIASSVIHDRHIDILENETEDYKIVDDDGTHYVYVKTPKYTGNGKSRIKNMLAYGKMALKAAEKLPKPDIVISCVPNHIGGAVAAYYAKKCKVPCICDTEDLWPESIVAYNLISKNNLVTKLLYQGEKWIYKNSTALIFSMKGCYDYIKERHWEKDIPQEKVFYVNMGVNVADFDANAKNEVYADSCLQKTNLFKVAYTGSVRLVNNLKLLCDAGKEILNRGVKDVFIMIHGAGDQVEELQQYCKEEGIINVKLYGRVEKRHIPSILTQSDLCVLCYQSTPLLRFGGSMSKMFEYFASGKPVIANAKMGHSIIEEYNCGVELGSNDAAELADAILKFHDMSAEELQKYGTRSRQAAEDYDINKLCEKMYSAVEYAFAAYKKQ